MPLGFLLHVRKFELNHKEFLSYIAKEYPVLRQARIVFITDAEFNFISIFPNIEHIYCWNHIKVNILILNHIFFLQSSVKRRILNTYLAKPKEYMADVNTLLLQDNYQSFDKVKQ